MPIIFAAILSLPTLPIDPETKNLKMGNLPSTSSPTSTITVVVLTLIDAPVADQVLGSVLENALVSVMNSVWRMRLQVVPAHFAGWLARQGGEHVPRVHQETRQQLRAGVGATRQRQRHRRLALQAEDGG